MPKRSSAGPLLPLLDVNMLVTLEGYERTAGEFAEFAELFETAGLRLDHIVQPACTPRTSKPDRRDRALARMTVRRSGEPLPVR